MKFLIILIAATTVVQGFRHARYYESEYKMPQRYPRFGPPFAEQNRHYRDSFRQPSHPYLEESSYREQPPPYRDEKPFYSEFGQYSDHSSYHPERQLLSKKPLTTYREREPLQSYGNQEEFNYSSFPPQPLNDVTSGLPSQQLKQDQPRQSLSFGGHSNYLKFGNHALGFASVPIKSTSADNNELPTPSPTAASALVVPTTSSPDAHANDQSNTSEALQSVGYGIQPLIETNTRNAGVSANKGESSASLLIADRSKPLILSPTAAAQLKPESQVLASAQPIMISPQTKRLPFGISLPLSGFPANAYIRGGADVRYNHLLEESKSYQPFELQQSAAPEVLSYMLPQQISSPVKFASLPISSLSASPLTTIKYVPPSLPSLQGLPKLTLINHDAIHPQTSLSLASAFPVSEFGQNTVQLGQIGQLDAQRPDILQGLHLDLDGFGGIGGINYGAQASNSISKPVLGIAKVGLSLPEASRSIIPTFAKIGFGQQLW